MAKRVLPAIAVSFLLLISSFSLAHSQHHMSGEKQQTMKMPSTEVFSDGIEATFMVMMNENHKNMLKNMKMKEDLEPGSTHNIMILIKDEATGAEINNIPVTIKVTDPDDNEQIKKGSYKEMMRTYDAYFDLSKKGKYQIRIVFETKGQKKAIGTSYEGS